MAQNIVHTVTTREFNVVDSYFAEATVLSPCGFLAVVATRSQKALAWLRTGVDTVHTLRITSRLASVAAVIKTSIASQLAASFRAESDKVLWLTNLKFSVGVPRATQAESCADRFSGLQHSKYLNPHWLRRVGLGVADQIHPVLSAAEENINPVGCPEEPDLLLFVASDK
ncbi:MAG: hypothetical protein Q9181_003185 [Wetmoreana brouardii]